MTAEVLWARLQDVLDATLALRRTAVDDRPAGDVLLLDVIEDELAGLLAVVEEAVAAAAEARGDADPGRARAARRRCHALVEEADRLLAAGVDAPAARQARHDLAAERGGVWRAWNVAFDQDLARWREALQAARGR
jgi:hypothetical protein